MDLQGKCGVCLQSLAAGVLTACPECRSSYHAECWIFNRRKCAVYGCWKSPFPRRRLGPAQQHADIFNPWVLGMLVAAVVATLIWSFFGVIG